MVHFGGGRSALEVVCSTMTIWTLEGCSAGGGSGWTLIYSDGGQSALKVVRVGWLVVAWEDAVTMINMIGGGR